MEQKYQLALALLLGGACGGILLTSLSYRIRDIFFFLMVTLSAVTEFIDVNFVSREWYRGTTCGYEVSLVGRKAGTVTCSNGMQLTVPFGFADFDVQADLLIVAGGPQPRDVQQYMPQAMPFERAPEAPQPSARPGRLTPDERRALRQQINDAGRDLYRAPRP